MELLSAYRLKRMTLRERAAYKNLKEQLLSHTAVALFRSIKDERELARKVHDYLASTVVFDDEKALFKFIKKKKRERKGCFVMIRGIDDERLNMKMLEWSVRFFMSSVCVKGNMNVWYIRFGKAKKEKKIC